MSEYDFGHAPERRGTDSNKWRKYAGRDVIPMWVADMDFAAPPAVIDALKARIEHGVFGYADPQPVLIEAVCEALARDYRWHIQPEWIVWLPGMVSALNIACHAAGQPGEGVFTATPIYPPFLSAPHFTARSRVTAPLQRIDNRWHWDFDQVGAAIRNDTRLFMLCNPHNPVGRAWSRDELQQIATLCQARDLILCSDEIHCGLMLEPGLQHLPIATLDESVARRTITLMAPSKTWNIAGLYCTFAIIPEPGLRRRFTHAMRGIVPQVNALGFVAAEAAYRYGEPWRRALIDYLRHNRDAALSAINTIPGLWAGEVEATYLAWIDCTALPVDQPARFFEQHGVGLSDGADFGAPGFVRLNFACPRSRLLEALQRMAHAVETLA